MLRARHDGEPPHGAGLRGGAVVRGEGLGVAAQVRKREAHVELCARVLGVDLEEAAQGQQRVLEAA